VYIIFDATLESYARYNTNPSVISLSPHDDDFCLIPAIEHEAAHHRQHQHDLLILPVMAVLRQILVDNNRSEIAIKKAILTKALPYLRMTEYDAFGRQAIFIHDYLTEAADGKALFEAYLSDESPTTLRAFMTNLIKTIQTARHLNTPVSLANIYAAGAITLSDNNARSYDRRHFTRLTYLVDQMAEYGTDDLFRQRDDEILTTSPVTLYASRIADDTARAACDDLETNNLITDKLYTPITYHLDSMLNTLTTKIMHLLMSPERGKRLTQNRKPQPPSQRR
jgi:hypothetical protein